MDAVTHETPPPSPAESQFHEHMSLDGRVLTLTIICKACGQPFYSDYEEQRCGWCIQRGDFEGGR